MSSTNINGTSAYHMKKTLNEIGIKSSVYECSKDMYKDIKLPVIAHMKIDNMYHYVVIYDINEKHIVVMDPSIGYRKYDKYSFLNLWTGIIITCSEKLKTISKDVDDSVFSFVVKLFSIYRKDILFISILSTIFVILSILYTYYFKYVIDGISNYNMYNISLIFLLIVILKLLISYLRAVAINKINIKLDKYLFTNTINHIISLPYSYFKNRTTGDIISRINKVCMSK